MKIAISESGVGKQPIRPAGILSGGKKELKSLLWMQIRMQNLASALGFRMIDIVPIAEMESLIEERTGAKPGTSGSLFK